MKLLRLSVQNFRCLENLQLDFPSFYSALCGRNDSGKTHVLAALRTVLREPEPYIYRRFEEGLALKDNYPQWHGPPGKEEKRSITIALEIEVDRERDEGLYRFLVDYLKLEAPDERVRLSLSTTYDSETPAGLPKLIVDGNEASELQAEEVSNKLQSSAVVLYYNSTDPEESYRYRGRAGSLGDLTAGNSEQLDALQQRFTKDLKKIAIQHQKDLAELLGKLKEKHKVGLSISPYGVEYLPLTITLGDKAMDVALERWGSGTRNRTLVLLTLFRARRIAETRTSAQKITPILVIEEPESFLHPSAQAEFGKLLQELAEEFKVQVVVTTHSPYFLSQENPQANILLERHVEKGQLRQTKRVPTDGADWMIPFGLALGLDNAEFKPWKDAFFSGSDAILLVEGPVDKEYFELLRDAAHGDAGLKFDGEIFPYGGKDILKNSVLLRFIKNRYRKLFITYDLDAEGTVLRAIESLGLERHRDFSPIGLNEAGKRSIEGFLPEEIPRDVYARHAGLVQQAMHGSAAEKESAQNRLKQLQLEEFRRRAQPGDQFYGRFYKLVKEINKALK